MKKRILLILVSFLSVIFSYYANSPSQSEPISSDGLSVSSNTIDWLLSVGVLRYGLGIADIEKLLEQNKENYCGIRIELKPIKQTEDACLKKKKVIAHGKAFEGEYYSFQENPAVGTVYKEILLAVKNGKSSFALVRPMGSCYNQIVTYLPGDDEGMSELCLLAMDQLQRENKHRKRTFKFDYIEEFKEEMTSLKKWKMIEDNLCQFLHDQHTKEEIKQYCAKVLGDINPQRWLLKECPYKLYPTETILDYLGCFKKDFKPDTCLSLVVDELFAYKYLFVPTDSQADDITRRQLAQEKDRNYQISVFECYYKDDKLLAVIMKRHPTPFAEGMAFSALDMVFLTRAGMIFSSFCIENKNNHSLYGTFDDSYIYWKVE
ncbi:MAG TPA: hypothetical protein PKJ37_07090 [Acidobacteriota bacterium]|nr:hypothetical protein [Acidobacteriota bacterium]